MERFISKTRSLIFSKQQSIISSALLISIMIVLARIFGFFRYRILATYFSKEYLDIFFASFRIPDLVFEILITGALTSAFIPVYIKFQKNKDELNLNISSIINIILSILIVFIIILIIFLDKIMILITPGFDINTVKLIVDYSRTLLIFQLPFLILGNFLTGIGQAEKTFFLPATAPIIYNLAIIIFTILFSHQLFLLAPIIGVIIGAILLFLVQIPILFNCDFRYLPIIKITRGVKDFVTIVIPRIMTVITTQIDATIDLTLTTVLGAGNYTIFYFAQHLQLLPVSVIGIALGQASLPYLSEIFNEKKLDQFKKIITDSILNISFLTIPIAFYFIIARTPLIRFFFGGDKFDWEATVNTAYTLSYFSLSLPFHANYYLITRCFYAMLDSRTPFIVSLISIILNTGLSLLFVFVFKLPVWALGASFSVSIIANTSILFFILNQKISGFPTTEIVIETIKITLVSFIAALISYFSLKLIDGLIIITNTTLNVMLLLVVTFLIFVSIYLYISWLFNIKEIFLLTKLLIKVKEFQKKITEFHLPYE